ncbi:glycoside hydrolase family 97 catalytic domain-containing protein [Xanthocytophaga agilis]|uniref:Glycoside hydrolase family 97 catalytic domain-containing protein n=1 Tax=Xanthocytophaga agilis TaxID=3048010 RepID=A0AAE3R3K2_9BACT|nr:glycoside hydrolase family 97 catalytic domain-containing protein [Xanthocytophaga agilis]MDJ1500770.1 glycoside hydrolase family 97 catalytic domain-containing protein [Xanthocytophaga agilis]
MIKSSTTKCITFIILLFNCFIINAQVVKQDTLQIPPAADSAVTPHIKRGARITSTFYDSPEKHVRLAFDVYDNVLQYQVFVDGENIIAGSNLGLRLSDGSDLYQNMKVTNSTTRIIKSTTTLTFNEKKSVENNFTEITIELEKKTDANKKLQLIFRLYEEGVAFQYYLPMAGLTSSINAETTEFSFIRSDLNIFMETATESGYTEMALNGLGSYNEIPVTLKGNGFYCSINEANNQSYSRARVYRNRNNTLNTQLVSGSVSFSGVYRTPWRYLVFAKTAIELADRKYMLYKLNDDNQLSDVSWMKPGKVIRVITLDTQHALNCINFAASNNLQYILFDAGWYGLGYSYEHNAASDPRKVIAAIDMPAVISYANSKGVGVLLYVNQVAFDNYNVDEFFTLYKNWGIKGIKMGFVEGRTQKGIVFLQKMIKKAAEYKFILNIHDQYRPSGTSQAYPNLMTVEGVRGNEYRTNTALHTTTLPFTRFLTGAADYTVCYPDPDKQNPPLTTLQTSKAHQLALSMVFFSPLQHVLWYGVPEHYNNPTEIEFFRSLPTVWDDTRYLNGEIGKYITVARRSGNKWFVGVMNGLTSRTVTVPLDFLEGASLYKVTSYEDKNSSIRKDTFAIAAGGALSMNLAGSSGKVFIIEGAVVNPEEPGSGGDTTVVVEPPLGVPGELESHILVYPNPSTGNFSLTVPDGFVRNSQLVITDLTGRLVSRYVIDKPNTNLSLTGQARGMYIMSIIDERNGNTYRRKIILQ